MKKSNCLRVPSKNKLSCITYLQYPSYIFTHRQRVHHRLAAPRRDQARPRRDGRLRRLHHPRERHPLAVGAVDEVRLRVDRRALGAGGVGRDPRGVEVADHRDGRLLRVLVGVLPYPREGGRLPLHVGRQARLLPHLRRDPAPGAAQPVGPLRLHQEALGRGQGEEAQHRGEQRCVLLQTATAAATSASTTATTTTASITTSSPPPPPPPQAASP